MSLSNTHLFVALALSTLAFGQMVSEIASASNLADGPESIIDIFSSSFKLWAIHPKSSTDSRLLGLVTWSDIFQNLSALRNRLHTPQIVVQNRATLSLVAAVLTAMTSAQERSYSGFKCCGLVLFLGLFYARENMGAVS